MTPDLERLASSLEGHTFTHEGQTYEVVTNASEQIRRALRIWLKSKSVTKSAKPRAATPLHAGRTSARAKAR